MKGKDSKQIQTCSLFWALYILTDKAEPESSIAPLVMFVSSGSARAHAEITKLLASGVGCIKPRDGFPDPGPLPTDALRFSVGETVLCQVGTWKDAVVVKQWYREPDWATGR